MHEPASAAMTGAGFVPRDRRILLVILAASVLYVVAYLIAYFRGQTQGPLFLFGDFYAFWSESRFVAEHDPRQLYDAGSLAEFQRALRGDLTSSGYPFPYPPPYLLLIWPLGFLPYVLAFAVWMVFTVGLYVVAVLGRRSASLYGVALLAAPTSVIAFVSGQNGFLTAGLLVGGFRLAGTWPRLAGILIGCLCYKPQLAILLPVALAAGGYWLAFLAAGLTVAALCLISLACFGASMWQDWLRSWPEYFQLLGQNIGHLQDLMPTVTANLAEIGVGPGIARWVQLAVALATAVTIWLIFRRGRSMGGWAAGELRVAALCIATFLVTPYAFVYDMPVMTAAVILCVLYQYRIGGEMPSPERMSLITIWLSPLLILSDQLHHFPAASALFGLLYVLIARRCLSPSNERTS